MPRPPSRRALLAALVACSIALAGAVTPWTVSSDALNARLSAQVQNLSGLTLAVAGPATIALLPIPRVTFAGFTLAAPNGTPVARGEALRGEFRILPLLAARVRLSELSLTTVTAELDVEENGGTLWDRAVADMGKRLAAADASAHIARVVVRGADLRVRDRRTGSEAEVRDINLAAVWPTPTSSLDISGSMSWRGEPVQIRTASVRPDALRAGRASPLKIEMSAPLASLAVTGEVSLHEDRHLAARAAFATRSLRDFSTWSGAALPAADLIQAFSLEGDVRVDGQGISWPAARLSVGGDKLDGALFWRVDGERSTITSTLAADRLDLTAFSAALARLRSPSGWSSESVDLPAQSGTDLDLRLSASSARLGLVRMTDLAANLSVKPGRYEASIGRVTLNRGVAKGRAVLASAGDGFEIKGQSTFERLDMAAFLADLGLSRWVAGSAGGQVTFEASGETPAEIVRNLNGRANVTMRQGEFVGVGLTDMARRVEGKPLATPVAWRSGRVPFDQTSFNVNVANGVAEIADAKLTAPGVHAALEGRASLTHRTVAVKASVDAAPTASGQAMLFDITGPWSGVTIVPGARPSQDAGSAPAVQ